MSTTDDVQEKRKVYPVPVPELPPYLRDEHAEQYLGLGRGTLSSHRSRFRKGLKVNTPPWSQAGGIPIYSRADLDAWVASNKIDPNAMIGADHDDSE